MFHKSVNLFTEQVDIILPDFTQITEHVHDKANLPNPVRSCATIRTPTARTRFVQQSTKETHHNVAIKSL